MLGCEIKEEWSICVCFANDFSESCQVQILFRWKKWLRCNFQKWKWTSVFSKEHTMLDHRSLDILITSRAFFTSMHTIGWRNQAHKSFQAMRQRSSFQLYAAGMPLTSDLWHHDCLRLAFSPNNTGGFYCWMRCCSVLSLRFPSFSDRFYLDAHLLSSGCTIGLKCDQHSIFFLP